MFTVPSKKKKNFIFQNPFFMQLLKGQDNLSKILRGGRKNTKSQEKILYKLWALHFNLEKDFLINFKTLKRRKWNHKWFKESFC